MEWISVKDRLPEPYKLVVAYRPRKHQVIFCGYDGRIWWQGTTMISRGAITHWMPLPEPPKE